MELMIEPASQLGFPVKSGCQEYKLNLFQSTIFIPEYLQLNDERPVQLLDQMHKFKD